MGKHANYLDGMASWRLAATLALGRNTWPPTLKDEDTARELGMNAEWRLVYMLPAALYVYMLPTSSHATKPG